MTPPPQLPATTLLVLGAPGTGARTLCAAMASQPLVPGLRVVCGEDLGDGALAAALHSSAESPTAVLLMGLDLPCAASHRAAQEACDARLRRALADAGCGYRVVYGQGSQRIDNALRALNAIKTIAKSALSACAEADLDSDFGSDGAGRFARLRAWNCEKCSDPVCEHRLFTARAGQSAAPAA